MRRRNGSGGYERANGKVRKIQKVQGRRLKGPWSRTEREADAGWSEWHERPQREVAAAADLPLKTLGSWLFPEDTTSPHPLKATLDARWSPSTYDTYRRHWASIAADPIARRTPREITTAVAQPYIAKCIASGTKPKTIRNRWFLVQTIIRLSGLEPPIVGLPDLTIARRRVIGTTDHEALLALARNETDELIVRLLFLGVRRSELAGLRHDDVDESGIHISRAAVRTKGRTHIKTPKTARSARFVPIIDPALRALIGPPRTGWIFPRPGHTHEPMNPEALSDRFRHMVAGTRFEGLSPQSLRRSLATQFANSQVPPATGARIMGHSVQMMLEIYAQVQHEQLVDAMKKALGENGA